MDLTINQKILRTEIYPALLQESELFLVSSSEYSSSHELTIKLPLSLCNETVNNTVNIVPSNSKLGEFEMEQYIFLGSRKNKYKHKFNIHENTDKRHIISTVYGYLRAGLGKFFSKPVDPPKLSDLEKTYLGDYPIMNQLRSEQKYIMAHILDYISETPERIENGISYRDMDEMRSRVFPRKIFTSEQPSEDKKVMIFNLPRRFGKSTIVRALIEKFNAETKSMDIFTYAASSLFRDTVRTISSNRQNNDQEKIKMLAEIGNFWIECKENQSDIISHIGKLVQRYIMPTYKNVYIRFKPNHNKLTVINRTNEKEWDIDESSIRSINEAMKLVTVIVEDVSDISIINTIRFCTSQDSSPKSIKKWRIYDDCVYGLSELKSAYDNVGTTLVFSSFDRSDSDILVEEVLNFCKENPGVSYLAY